MVGRTGRIAGNACGIPFPSSQWLGLLKWEWLLKLLLGLMLLLLITAAAAIVRRRALSVALSFSRRSRCCLISISGHRIGGAQIYSSDRLRVERVGLQAAVQRQVGDRLGADALKVDVP